MDLKAIREQKHITQEELAEQSGLSVRTIQRIEAGAKPKGHTAKVLAEVLKINSSFFNDTEIRDKTINSALVKRVNLSSALVCFIPFLNIVFPVILSRYYKQNNHLTKGIITLQILWTIVSTTAVLITGFLKLTFDLHHQTGLWVAIAFIVINLVIILVNSASIDKSNSLSIKLKFSII